MASTFPGLPLEVMTAIFSQLIPHGEDQQLRSANRLALYNLCLVSRQVRDIALPMLYHRVELQWDDGLRAFLRTISETNHGLLTRHFDLAHPGSRHIPQSPELARQMAGLPRTLPHLKSFAVRGLPRDLVGYPRGTIHLARNYLSDGYSAWWESLETLDLSYSVLRPFLGPKLNLFESVTLIGSNMPPRALTTLNLERTDVDDATIEAILLDPSFANLKSLNLASCSFLRNVGHLLHKAFTGQDPAPLPDGHDDGEKMGRVVPRLTSLVLSHTYLLDTDGIGEDWETEEDEEWTEDDDDMDQDAGSSEDEPEEDHE
ncbi:uncharacterized protein PFL1_00912 [Pseudozyma flocculosa PF-1]|uniref:Uncharacterized protein n=1 Tax=Pseudozyma flocculosa TaxID=84751 RepID=A0A5C3F3F6_9BASI|nr:uncharacterized protein PFL1_00912 [Pseudozyma flocculosa PF-1]EPQ31579.1 hypothetical protein PFL1_00912 [Pseudozyma flocculosa PF-1]SPO38630.1 uncharacterized protein PSFLO_04109 [Pseudozyma flocculosa]